MIFRQITNKMKSLFFNFLKHTEINFVMFLIVILLFSFSYYNSQTGPAGVGTSNTNVFWLKADRGTSSTINNTPLSSWNDQSGNGINVTQTVAARQPSFAINIMNGFPAIQFDNNNTAGQNDFLIGPDSPILDNTPGYSIFTTSRLNFIGTDARCIVSKRTAVDVDEAFMLFYWNSNYFYLDIDGLGNRFNTNPVTYTTNTNYMLNGWYNGTLPAALRSRIYEEEQLRTTAFETSALVPDKPSPINIGCTHSSDNRPFGGYISEIIIYTITVNDAQRIIVNNYTSSKYNIALTSNDKYSGDIPANGNYDFEVAGVGRESSGSNPTFSPSIAAGIGINTNSGLDVGDYIIAGHASTVNAQINYDVVGMTGTANARWLRIWYVDVTNTSTPINTNIEFDMSDGGLGIVTLGPAINYVLLYRAAQIGAWTELATATSVVGDKVFFNNYNLTLDGYYTIGTKNSPVSPLPIDVLDFNAKLINYKTKINWASVTYDFNSYYVIEKSNNGVDFEILSTIKGKNSNTNKTNYYETDENPFAQTTYYRLGKINSHTKYYSTLVSVTNQIFENNINISIEPNPNEGNFLVNISKLNTTQADLSIIDGNGKLCFSRSYFITNPTENINIELNNKLAKGTYILSVKSNNRIYNKKIIVK